MKIISVSLQEEIRRREHQIHETAKQMEARLEMERLQLEEKVSVVVDGVWRGFS